MSQFDFPRINFSGQSYINPGTANNNVFLPLVIFDPIQVSVVIPPRIYLSPELLMIHKLGGLPLPEKVQIEFESSNQQYFVEIEAIQTVKKFKFWARTPLGECPDDKDYHELYELVRTKRTGQPLTGCVPAYWNYYGGMEFGFRGVTVKSIELMGQDCTPSIFNGETELTPPEIRELINAKLDLKNDDGSGAAVMVDTLPSLAMFSQVFCDSLRLKKGDKYFLGGNPLKASLRFLNLDRIVNQEGVFAGSGTFYMAIPMDQLDESRSKSILSLFEKYQIRNGSLKGVFIRFNLFEIQEDQSPDYSLNDLKANPATTTVAGSITPWYLGEMRSITMGRQFLPERPFLDSKSLASFVGKIDHENKMISLDLLGSVPQIRLADAYETYLLGKLSLILQLFDHSEIKIADFYIDPIHFSRARILRDGGILDLSFHDQANLTERQFENGRLSLYGYARNDATNENERVMLMQESDYMVASDQAGIYAEQSPVDTEKYRSYGMEREACQVRVFRRGKPSRHPMPMTIMELKITATGATTEVREFLNTKYFYDGQQLSFSVGKATNAMYVFLPGQKSLLDHDLISEIQRTGFFISLRVLPKHDYGKYLNPGHPEYPMPIPFQLIYEELLQTYEMILPISSEITPFTEAYFRKGAKFLLRRLSPNNWHSYTYMPSTRDMSEDQWHLFCKWVEQG